MPFKIIPVEGFYGVKPIPFPEGFSSSLYLGEILLTPFIASTYSVGKKVLFKPDGLPLVRTPNVNAYIVPESSIFAMVEITEYL